MSSGSLWIALVALAILTYGIHLFWMGFYWDDWPWVWFSEVMGPSGMLKIDVEHRPISGVVLWLGSMLSGDNPTGWQIYNLAWRLLGAVALGWALRQIWPRQHQQIAWVALLFLIYPGFGQQFVSVNNSRHLFPLIPFFLSIGLMAWANWKRAHYWLLTSAAMLLSILTMFTTEYYYGLELARPLVLWLVRRDPQEPFRATLGKVLRTWPPYLILLTGVFIWRFVISKSVNYGITLLDELQASPAVGVVAMLGRGAGDIVDAAVMAWAGIFRLPDPVLFGPRAQIYFLGFVVLSAAATLVYLYFLRSGPREASWGAQAIVLGAGALLVAPIPFWVTRLDPRLAFPGDRLNLPMMLGACLMVAGLLELALKSKALKISILAILIGLSAGQHYQNAVSYRRDWQHQEQIFEQLTLRIPGLKAGTTLLSNELPSEYSTDNSLVAPLNWTYAPEFSSGKLPVFIYYSDLRFRSGKRQIEAGARYSELYRFYPFQSSADQILVIYQQLPGCLRVLDAEHHQKDPTLPDEIRELLVFSNLEQIVTTGNAELPPPFHNGDLATEPKGWCTYFEQADLARQVGNWEQAAEFGDLAFEAGFPDAATKHVAEYVVFIEGYAHNGAWERARDLTLEAYTIEPLMRGMLCDAWERIEAETAESAGKPEAVEKVNKKLGCD